MTQHVLPINDVKEHIEESTCECGPTLEILENGDMMFIHNSYDGREKEEEEQDCCPNCGECENIHVNYDWYQKHRPVEEYLCNECGIYFKPKEIRL
jgi:hypothetical protein